MSALRRALAVGVAEEAFSRLKTLFRGHEAVTCVKGRVKHASLVNMSFQFRIQVAKWLGSMLSSSSLIKIPFITTINVQLKVNFFFANC